MLKIRREVLIPYRRWAKIKLLLRPIHHDTLSQ
jgi:hypothetical protein